MQIATIIISSVIVLGIITSVIFYPNIDYKKFKLSTFWLIALLGAIVLLSIHAVPLNNVYEAFTSNSSINPLKILALFLSMTLLSIFLDNFGFFQYIAIKFANKFSKNQYSLFFGLYFIISLLTIFTSNDIIILTFTPFICYFCKHCKIKALPYLIMEFVAANTWSMCLIIGNPTNIYLATSFNIDFFNYFVKMIVPTLFASLISLLLLFIIFRKTLKAQFKIQEVEVTPLDKIPVTFGLVILCLATVLLAISSYVDLPMWLIACSFAVIELLFMIIYSCIKQVNYFWQITKRLPWNLVPFVLSMFVVVLSLDNQGVTTWFTSTLNSINQTYSYGLSGAMIANMINNIPMSVLYSSILTGKNIKAIYASIIASNIAAYITPIGALAGIMFMRLTKTLDCPISFLDFIKYGIVIGIPTLLVALTVLEFIVVY